MVLVKITGLQDPAEKETITDHATRLGVSSID